ncbi:hypothetical protein B0H14DRAFT_2642149 [Mycena olivaceomarginata]|nr:hypothetical protein B0H14DRAFT_2642149 [Mycena olivaceomarginata]
MNSLIQHASSVGQTSPRSRSNRRVFPSLEISGRPTPWIERNTRHLNRERQFRKYVIPSCTRISALNVRKKLNEESYPIGMDETVPADVERLRVRQIPRHRTHNFGKVLVAGIVRQDQWNAARHLGLQRKDRVFDVVAQIILRYRAPGKPDFAQVPSNEPGKKTNRRLEFLKTWQLDTNWSFTLEIAAYRAREWDQGGMADEGNKILGRIWACVW